MLWLYGPPGVGKTTVGWELFEQLPEPVGLVDIDQLGMCYAPATPDEWAPEPASDPGRHRMQARNLDAVLANFAAAGVRCVVVPGVVDAGRGAPPLANGTVIACRLRASPDELRRRLAVRGNPADRVDDTLSYAVELDLLPGPSVDTSGLEVAEVVRLVRAHLPAVEPVAPVPWPAPVGGPGEILLLCGPTAVGTSTVGWRIRQELCQAGVLTAFADLRQIGFARPDNGGNHRLKAANLAAMWRTFRARGARRMVVAGRVDDVAVYRAALPDATLTVCRLRASPDVLTARIMMRGRREGPTWGLAGDELTGKPADLLRDVPARAAAEAAALDRAGIGDLCVDTDHRAVQDIVEEIRAGW
ncbi:AAA domain-containing protein [Asanoa hainanensis]|uniref:AAA domain-containing protein n=1 Tax=Asanoa hainanensis TaxID=560556 RepID=A0A239NKW3_9ACTN|nr:AAA domain-containing protein [Asanoa hainanensis]